MTPELHRPLRMGAVGAAGRAERLVATPAECAALARRFGIPAMGSLSATLSLRPDSDGAILAEGGIEAEVTQSCVVSLEPVTQRISAPVRLRFLPPGVEPNDDPESADEIETDGDTLDLGEAVAEQLALSLDPYPRRPDAVLPADVVGSSSPEPPPAPSPFASLGRLRRG
jgi:uncharacterized metal-binding protein YceD (DUF177 family)